MVSIPTFLIREIVEDSKPPSNKFAKSPVGLNFSRGRCVSLYTLPYLFEPSHRDQLHSVLYDRLCKVLNLQTNSCPVFSTRMAQPLL